MSKLDVENQNLSSENLQNIQWSETSIALCDFVTTYPLPQIVQVEEGYHGGSDENSLSSGQVLKIHTLTTERKLQCQDRHGKELHIPVHTQKINLKPENYDTVYQKVQDLSHAKPLPKYVEVTRGYYDIDSEVDYELSVDPGEVLEVIEVNESNIFTKKTRSMTFRNSEGVVLKIPFDCVAGFKPLVDNAPKMLSDVIPSDSNGYKYPFHFQFVGASSSKLGVVKAKSTYDDHLIIASCGQGQSQVVFMIPQNLKVKVKVAVGTLKEDPEYENIRRSYHNFKSIEKDLKKSRSFKGRLSSTASEIVGIPVKNNQQDWVTFEQEEDESNIYNPQGNSAQHMEKRNSMNGGPTNFATPMNQPIDHSSMEKRGSMNGHSNFATPMNPAMDPLAQQRRSSSVQYPMNGINGFNRSHNGSMTSINGHSENHLNGGPAIDKYKEIRELSVQQLAEKLKNLNMEKHMDVFVENQIDGELFLHLDEEEMRDLNLTKFEIKKLNRFKDGWRPKID